MKKKTLYICIEIKNREYDSQILLAFNAALHGYRVYLGTHAAIYALIKNKEDKSGILLDKGTQPKSRVVWNRSRVQYYCVLDAELSPIMEESTARLALESRIYPGTAGLLDRFMVVGPAIEKVAKEYFVDSPNIVITTGWPRIDIWANYGKTINQKEIDAIKGKYGNFLLFASSFGNIRDPQITSKLRNADQVVETDLNKIDTLNELYRNFNKLVEVLIKWDSIIEIPPIIVRPHTSEQVHIWKEKLKGLKKTFVTNSGEITPWIESSLGLLHCGSTTSIQAYLANKPVLMFEDLTNSYFHAMASRVSKYLVDADSFFSVTDFSKLRINGEYSPEKLKSVIELSSMSSIEKVIEVLDELDTNPSFLHKTRKLIISQISIKSLRRAIGLLRDEITWRMGTTNINSQFHFVPWGLDRKRIKRIKSIKSDFHKIKAKKKTINLWEIEV